MTEKRAWKVSLHGGHSGTYCDHAVGSLSEVLEAAVAFGYQTFGVSEHAPRYQDRFLYPEEREMGWTIQTLEEKFDAYVAEVRQLADTMADRLTVLCGFEAEVVPNDRYADLMLGLREQYNFDYMVGSVHHVHEITIDGPKAMFDEAVEASGGLERLAIAYYESIAEMVQALSPEVVSHFDLVRKNAPDNESVETTAIRDAARHALHAVRDAGAILDLNTAGYRKNLGDPYPRPWVIREALDRGIPFCFGDDSHGPEQVGLDVDRGRDYLLANDVEAITFLTRIDGEIVRQTAPLDD